MRHLDDEEVSEEETQSGIVIGVFWWACSNIHFDMVFDDDGKPDYSRWSSTNAPHQAYQWNSKAAAYKFLRENPALAAGGYQVIDLHDLGWPRMVPNRLEKKKAELNHTSKE